jgi:hypothetical protein
MPHATSADVVNKIVYLRGNYCGPDLYHLPSERGAEGRSDCSTYRAGQDGACCSICRYRNRA